MHLRLSKHLQTVERTNTHDRVAEWIPLQGEELESISSIPKETIDLQDEMDAQGDDLGDWGGGLVGTDDVEELNDTIIGIGDTLIEELKTYFTSANKAMLSSFAQALGHSDLDLEKDSGLEQLLVAFSPMETAVESAIADVTGLTEETYAFIIAHANKEGTQRGLDAQQGEELTALRHELEHTKTEYSTAMETLLQALPKEGEPGAAGPAAAGSQETILRAIENLTLQAATAAQQEAKLRDLEQSVAQTSTKLQLADSRLAKSLQKHKAELQEHKDKIQLMEKEAKETRWEYDHKVQTLEKQVAELQKELQEKSKKLVDKQGHVEKVEKKYQEQVRMNRILGLENAFAIQQLKDSNVSGVSIMQNTSALLHSPQKAGAKSPLRTASSAPLDPTSRQAKSTASPARREIASDIKTIKEARVKSRYLYQLENFQLAKEIYLSSLVSSQMETNRVAAELKEQGLALDSSSPLAVDIMVEDFITRFRAVSIDLPHNKLGPATYEIAGMLFRLKNMNGHLVVRKGGGYHDLIDIIEKIRVA